MNERPHTERWAYRLLYTGRIFELTSQLAGLLGRGTARGVSRLVAGYYAATQPAVTRAVLSNLRLLDPTLPPASARRAFRNYATVIADYVSLSTRNQRQAMKLCGEFSGQGILADAAREGGAILATGHFGFFEFGAVTLADAGIPVTVATLAEPSDALTAWRAGWRRRWGAETITVGDDPFSSLELQRAIAEGRFVAMLVDRPQKGQGIPCATPGGRAPFSISPAVFSLLSGRPIIPVTVTLRPDGRYRVAALPALQTQRVPHDQRHGEIARCVRALAESLLGEFTKTPEQWFQFADARDP